jgi:O-antigen/teichoic acid export membrane protein
MSCVALSARFGADQALRATGRESSPRLAMNIAGNVFANVSSWIWPLLLAIVSTRVLLHSLGAERYGVLILIGAIVGLFGFANLGLTFALMKHLSHDVAIGNLETARRLVGTAAILSIGAGAAVLLILNELQAIILHTVLGVNAELRREAEPVFRLTTLALAVSLLSSVYYAVVAALQRYRALAFIRILTATMLTVGQIVLALTGQGLVALAAANAIVAAVGLTLLLGSIARSGQRSVLPLIFDRRSLQRLLSFGAFRTVDVAATVLLMQVDRVFVGTYAGTAAATFYAIPQGIAQQLSHMSTSIAEPLFPRFSALVATGDSREAARLYLKATRLVAWFVTTTVSVVVIMAPPLFTVWLGQDYGNRIAPLMPWLSIAWGTLALSLVAIFALNARGLPQVNAAIRLVQATTLVVLCLVMVPTLGPLGAALSLVVAMGATVPPFVALVTKKVAPGHFLEVVNMYSKCAIVGGAIGILGLAIRNIADGAVPTLLTLLLLGTVSLGLGLILQLITVEERDSTIAAIRARVFQPQTTTT